MDPRREVSSRFPPTRCTDSRPIRSMRRRWRECSTSRGGPPIAALPLIAADVAQIARELGRLLTRTAERLAERFWPGPLTLVLSGARGNRCARGDAAEPARWACVCRHHAVARALCARGRASDDGDQREPRRARRPRRRLMTWSGRWADASIRSARRRADAGRRAVDHRRRVRREPRARPRRRDRVGEIHAWLQQRPSR